MSNISTIIKPKRVWLRRIGLWVTGIGSYYIFTWLYDYILISALLLYFGILKGAIIAMLLSMIVDFLTLKFYDWLKKDWLAIETLKEFNDKKGLFGKLFRFVHNRGAALTVTILSIFLNAFVVTTYMRNGAYKYNGLTKRDWLVFISSSIIGNGYWILMFAGGITLIKQILRLIL